MNNVTCHNANYYEVSIDLLHNFNCYHVTWHNATHSFCPNPYNDVSLYILHGSSFETILYVSFLSRKQVTIDGDVEANPGPVTPKGRKTKKRTFNFTPQKLDKNKMQNLVSYEPRKPENRTQISEKRNMRSKIRYTMSYNNHNDTSFDTSFLNRNQVVIDGDVESNPGLIQSIQAYRTSVGRFYDTARLKCKNFDKCYCQEYEIYL